MALTYVTVQEFLDAKDIRQNESGIVVDPGNHATKIVKEYLMSATDYIERNTRRSFIPWIETREYSIPHRFHDLALRRMPMADLVLDQDLLEILEVDTGVGAISNNYYYALEHNVKPHHSIAIKFPEAWGGLYGQNPIRKFNEAVIKIKGVWGYAENMGGRRYPDDFWLDTLSALESDITLTQTTIVITDADTQTDQNGDLAFTAGRLLKIDNEFLEIISVTGNNIMVLRGSRGSTASTHTENTKIYRWKVIKDIARACLQIASIWREADIQVAGRVGISDVSSGAEVSIPTDSAQIIRSYQRSIILEGEG